ncbi:unnamed protein product, partial [Protopolystoma xenopodis]
MHFSIQLSCPRFADRFLLVARPPGIYMLALPTTETVDSSLGFNGVSNQAALVPVATSGSLLTPTQHGHLGSTASGPVVTTNAMVAGPVRVDFDPIQSVVYWTDSAIHRVPLEGGDVETVVQATSSDGTTPHLPQIPNGLAVDWLAGQLYWCSADGRQLWTSKLDGSSARLLRWLDPSFIPVSLTGWFGRIP